jgi:hypothetical protein
MKKAAWLMLSFLLLTGCTGKRQELDRAMGLRAKLLASGCSFRAEVTADYGQQLYTFTMDCRGQPQGDLEFTVTGPDTISGITGIASEKGGVLTFDETALEFPLLADGQISPVSAPWILFRTLRGGYLSSVGEEDGLLRLSIDDSYADDALRLDIWLDGQDQPIRGEILYAGRRILTVLVTEFHIL